MNAARTLILQFLFVGCAHGNAQTHPEDIKNELLGTWELDSFLRITAEGKEIPWCKGAYGLLSYSDNGYMSASINCAIDTPSDSPSTPYSNMLLYAGTYIFKSADEVSHHVMNSSQADLLGKDLVRKVSSLENGVLILTGSAANNRGAFKIVWRKIR